MTPARHVAAGLLVLMLAACASAPVALVALPPAPPPDRPSAGPGPTVLLRDVTLPGYLDNFPVVISRQESTLVASKDTEWAERPSLGVARVLRDALSQRLGAARILMTGDGRLPDADLTIDFLALDPRADGLHLDARWVFYCSASGGSRGGRTRMEVPVARATPAGIAAATTEALARLAEVLAAEVPCQAEAAKYGDVAACRTPLGRARCRNGREQSDHRLHPG